MPCAKPEIVAVVPVPVVVILPGLRVNVHVPLDGKPFTVTLPVETLQVGCIVVLTEGAVGALGAALIMTLSEAEEVHPAALITEKV